MPQQATYRWRGKEIAAAVHEAAVRGLTKAGEHLLGESRNLVPLEEGTLERSGTVHVDEDNLTVTVAYDTAYAVVQHEDLTLKHAHGREAKYLEKPMNAERETMRDLVAAELRRAVQG